MFEYKCTNDKVEIEKEYDNNLVTIQHNDDEEISLLKELCNRVDFYELICSEPEYYLKLLEERKEAIDLLKEYDLTFLRETASDGCKDNLRIKFKIMKEDQFTEVGFFSDANDKSTYEEFNLYCKRFLKRSVVRGNVVEDSSSEDEEQNLKREKMFAFELEDTTMNEMLTSEDIFKDYSATLRMPETKEEMQEKGGVKDAGEVGKVHHEHHKDMLSALESLRASCPKEYLNDYDKMVLNIKFNKKQLHIPSKKVYEGLLKIYENTNDDAVKYEIDNFLFTNSGHLYTK
jgi:hypothetical protein